MRRLLLVFFFLPAAFLRAQPIMPLKPEELIKYLPAAPAGWTTTQSWAGNDFATWVTCSAGRDFKGPPIPPAPGAPPAPPAEIRVRLTDTGRWPERLNAFQGFAPGKFDGGEKVMVRNQPALVVERPQGVRTLICIADRFLFLIEGTHVEPDELKNFVDGLKLEALAAIPPSGETAIPRPVRITKVDELFPKKNKSYEVHWTPEED